MWKPAAHQRVDDFSERPAEIVIEKVAVPATLIFILGRRHAVPPKIYSI
jgi:hypothetical protein